MTKDILLSVHEEADGEVLKKLADCLKANDAFARQLRDFAHGLEAEQRVQGITWQPHPGQILICHFGLGFRPPEMIKTRPVIVISPKSRLWTRLCIVVPISSRPPNPPLYHHYKLPNGLLPGLKYEEAWVKGDTVAAVSCERLDRIKIGPRQYVSPQVPPDVLKEVRRCILHSTGMQSLTQHW
ncbi:type II toxin-antitoxin system PemK/MazF family toxin [Rhizobium sp. SL86]|uniref:type II toxin-antitoxin system PemK/MazF family toxin n=1 Tax=Rhizobium sp. SL86 TaxID=2995148 RepID=UPI00227424CE|nr:type II toxin-antitoxin system PemK/MazF family toxin [Rhizobium sp. SL86]MCY1665732.1 type II toxin-antitoxin system PemK/MazF family toxin [Rhizobium sp. SL86]